MNNANERLHPGELSSGVEKQETPLNTRLTHARVEHLIARRKETLRSVSADIGAVLRDALAAKIEYENACLLQIIESDARIQDSERRRSKVLPSEYFVQKPLNDNIL